MGRLARRLCVSLAMAYVCSAALLVLGEELLLRWHTRGGSVQGSGSDVWLRTEDGVRIHARHYAREMPLTLVYFHGGAGNLATRSDRLELFASLGASLLAVEYRGYGRSEGVSSERGLERDARAAYRWLRERAPAHGIIPFGESLGGGPATWLSAHHPVGGLILLSTSTSIPALAGHHVPWLPTQALVRTRFDNLRRVKRVKAPKLFIHSRADEVVPFAMAEALWNAAPPPKQHLWLRDVSHDDTFYGARQAATQAMREFLSSLPSAQQ